MQSSVSESNAYNWHQFTYADQAAVEVHWFSLRFLSNSMFTVRLLAT